MAKKITTHTGAKALVSGQYRLPTNKKTEITLTKGDRVPPYRGKAHEFVLADKTKHTKK